MRKVFFFFFIDYLSNVSNSADKLLKCKNRTERWRGAGCHSGFPWFAVFSRLIRQEQSWDPAAGHACVGSVCPHPPAGGQRSGRPSLRRLGMHTGLYGSHFVYQCQKSVQKSYLTISNICYDAALCSFNRCNHVRQRARLQLRQW